MVIQAQKMRQQAGHINRGGVGQTCEISTFIFAGKFIVVVNSEIPCTLNKKESLLGWFSLRGFSKGIAQKSVSNVWLNVVYCSFISTSKFQIA
jgi:hypothetical protein